MTIKCEIYVEAQDHCSPLLEAIKQPLLDRINGTFKIKDLGREIECVAMVFQIKEST